jgi:SAM-dependent methyltransferase
MGLKSRVPKGVKAMARPVYWRLSDAAAKSKGTFTPPRRLASQVPGDFVSVGREFLGYFRNLAQLRPEQRVLDIGCGPGRMAIPLTAYLSQEGSYEGVDDWSEAVEWCSKNITPRFGNFGFRSLEDAHPGGADSGGVAKFPYEDGTFDFAILCAISRLDTATFRSYVTEAGRLLRPGGMFLGTCYLSDGDSPHPELADRVHLSETDLREDLGSKGLRVEAVYRGSWNDNPNPLSYQDIVVAKKGV